MSTRRAVPLLLAASVAVAACSSGDDPVVAPVDSSAERLDPPEPTSATTSATTTPATTPPGTAPPVTTSPRTTPPETASDATTPGTLPAAPIEIAAPGPYAVGGTTITVGEGSDRPLTVEVWFPIAGDGAGLEPHRYTLLPNAYYDSPVALSATADQIADGPFPLVVYSHGFGGLRYLHGAYTEALAGHGYVVVAPDHIGSTTLDLVAGTTAAADDITLDRPTDVGRLIDAFTATGDDADGPASQWAPHIDADRIVVTGHSVGGYTSVAMVTGVATESGAIARDLRVDAVILLAPALSERRLPDDVIGGIDVPMLVVAGTSDESTPVEPNVTRLWDLSDNRPAYRVELVDGEHQTFTDLCTYLDTLPTLPDEVPAIVLDTINSFVGDACSPGAMDAGRATELTTTYAVEFLDEVLRGGDPVPVGAPADVIFDSR